MRKFLLLLILIPLTMSWQVYGQERVVSGRVTGEDGAPIPGANVVLKGTSLGTVTDSEGNYRLSGVPASGGRLVISFVGYQTQEVEIGNRAVVDVSLVSDITQLGEVVVTAQGIVREKRALGYGVTTVSNNLIEQRPETDIGRILQGKVPGLNVTSTGGVSGTGTNLIIRGYQSITGSNQPLFVVDGVPFNTNTNNAGTNFATGNQVSSSRFLDLDPNNIESISVLKGLNATVLYGDQGRNGVILITTRSGAAKKRPAEVTITQSVWANRIASLPRYQNNYGGGFAQNFGFFFSNWGPRFDEIDSVSHPIDALQDPTLRNQFPQFHGKKYAYRAYDHPGKAFFRTGMSSNTSVQISGGSEKTSISSSFAFTDEEGFTPGNTLKKFNFGLGVNSAVNERLSINSSFAFANTDMKTPPLNAGFGSNAVNGIPSIFANVLYTPRSVDLANLPFEAPADRRSVYFRSGNDIVNPKWAARYYKNTSLVRRFFNSTSLAYDLNENFSAIYRVGLDTYTEEQERLYNRGGGGGVSAAINNGIYRTVNITNTIWNHDIILSFSKRLSNDFNFVSKAGFNARNDYFTSVGIESEQQLNFGLFRHDNFLVNRPVSNFTEEQQRMGLYADVSLDYRNFLYLNLSGRNDWTSTVEKENRRIFYPGVSVSFIPTSAFTNLQSAALNDLKIRAAFGESAGFPRPYSTRNVLFQNPRGFVDRSGVPRSAQSVDNFLGNPNLRPERYREVEFGLEGRFLQNRLSADISVYERNTIDLITVTPIDPSTGFTATTVNVGKVRTRGFEVSLTGTVLKTNAVTWDATLNVARYNPIVTELGGSLAEVVIDGFSNLGNFAVPGRPFNVIKGIGILRDPNGNKVVAPSGQTYLTTPEIVELGNPNPDFTSSLINNISFKGFTLSMLWEYRHGGKIYSVTAATMLARGLTKDTDFDRSLSLILPGVIQTGTDVDGNPIYSENTTQINAAEYFFGNYFFSDEAFIFDGTTVRLRELSLAYQIPKNILSVTPFKSASISLTGSNLWFRAVNFPKYVNFDTDVLSLGVGNGLGFDFMTGPSARRFGATLRLTF
jgi:TonB-linked SusC/RagA family outer membrane protein